MNATPLFVIAALLCSLVSGHSWALNMQFLELDPLRFFTEEDLQLSEQTAINALNDNPDGTSSTWENPKTGNSGTITPLTTYQNEQGETCRKVKIVDRTEGLAGEDTVSVCKSADDQWKFVDKARSQ